MMDYTFEIWAKITPSPFNCLSRVFGYSNKKGTDALGTGSKKLTINKRLRIHGLVFMLRILFHPGQYEEHWQHLMDLFLFSYSENTLKQTEHYREQKVYVTLNHFLKGSEGGIESHRKTWWGWENRSNANIDRTFQAADTHLSSQPQNWDKF